MDSKALDCPTLSAKDRDEGERRVILIGAEQAYFRWCPDGKFMMGSPKDEEERDNRDNIETQHQVKLTKGFWIMETPVTVGMFRQFVKEAEDYNDEKRSHFVWKEGIGGKFYEFSWSDSKLPEAIALDNSWPVTCIIWEDAVAFCKWLSKEKSLDMRLPTEAEWEYACRAGKTEELPTPEKLKEMAWLPINGERRIHSVIETKEKKIPNAWGLYDMIGNTWEWCQDGYQEYSSESVTDPIGTKDENWRVLRGGSFASEVQNCRPASRNWHWCQDGHWKYSSNYLGFRVVCECEQQ